MKKVYDINTWEEVLSNLPQAYKEWFLAEGKYLRENITKNAKVLEVGCGEGRSIKDILPITKNITGIDIDIEAIEKTKKIFKNYSKIKMLVMDGTNLSFENNSFDYVLCMTTFANFGDKKYKILEEMRRVVRKEGFIIISVFSESAFDYRMALYKKINFPLKKIEGTTVFYDTKHDLGISEQFSEKELRNIFEKIKLKIVEIIKLNMAYICKLNK